MNYRFFFKNTKVSNEIIYYSQLKLEKICNRYANDIHKIIITLEQEGHNYKADCSLVGGKPFNFQLSSKSQDMQSSIDIILHKLQNLMYKNKDKMIHRYHNRNKKFRKENFIHDMYQSELERDWETLSIDAEDIIKFEKAKSKKSA